MVTGRVQAPVAPPLSDLAPGRVQADVRRLLCLGYQDAVADARVPPLLSVCLTVGTHEGRGAVLRLVHGLSLPGQAKLRAIGQRPLMPLSAAPRVTVLPAGLSHLGSFEGPDHMIRGKVVREAQQADRRRSP